MEQILGNIVNQLRDRIQAPERKGPQILLAYDAIKKISAIVTQENPHLEEMPFLGTGDQTTISEAIVTSKTQRRSGLRAETQASFVTNVDKEELRELFDDAYRNGTFQNIVLLGHLHPSGDTTVGGVKYHVEPGEELLNPSLDADIKFLNTFIELN